MGKSSRCATISVTFDCLRCLGKCAGPWALMDGFLRLPKAPKDGIRSEDQEIQGEKDFSRAAQNLRATITHQLAPATPTHSHPYNL